MLRCEAKTTKKIKHARYMKSLLCKFMIIDKAGITPDPLFPAMSAIVSQVNDSHGFGNYCSTKVC